MASQQRYKRSWKNYLLDANYQLRFTLTMLAVAAGLMAPLGYWVSQKASRATEVALNQIDGIRCPEELRAAAPLVPGTNPKENPVEVDLLDEGAMLPEGEAAPAGTEPEGDDTSPGSTAEGETKTEEAETNSAEAETDKVDVSGEAPEGDAENDDEERHVRPDIKVNIDDSEMPEAPVVVVGSFETTPPTQAQIDHIKQVRMQCLRHIETEKASILARKTLITNVLLLSGLVLLLGLGVYGIKTTHRVAGPLFKVGLYLAKLERNVYDTVYNLRKGDQLIEFYEHFKGAHAGVTKMQEEDRDRLRDAIALSKDAGLAAKDPKLATLVTELEALLDETEKSLGKQ